MAVVRGADGKFAKVEEAVFISNFKNLRVCMVPAIMREQKGKTLRFYNGKYTTTDPEEYAFLMNMVKNPSAMVKINCVKKLEIPENKEEEPVKKKKD